MKISREKLNENRQRILDAAAWLFRERGFDAVTVAEVMKAAELTHGGFYNHFTSKDDLIAKAFAHVLLPEPEHDKFAGVSLADFGRFYLSPEHVCDRGGGCIFGALGTEAARSSTETRQVMTESVRRQIERFAETAPGDTPEARRKAAIAQWVALIGTVLLARAVDDPALSDELLAATRETVEA